MSQAVVKIPSDYDRCTKENIEELEEKLKIQRNRVVRPMTIGLMGIEREKETGIPKCNSVKNDWGTYVKLTNRFFTGDIKDESITRNFSDLAGEDSWIAVMHIDGNNITQVVQHIIKNNPLKLHDFDGVMDRVMMGAAKKAYQYLIDKNRIKGDKIPIRPIVMGGDDLTIVCRADLALEYAEIFCENFEKLTETEFKDRDFGLTHLTSCTGIAFVKAKFPYYFAYKLADELCLEAKKDAKSINSEYPPSCIMFHKVQDSFTEDFSEIVKRELTTPETKENFLFGPYYIDKHSNEKWSRWSVETFKENVDELRKNNVIKNGLREWIPLKLRSDESAKQHIDRMKQIVEVKDQNIIDQVTIYNKNKSYPTYDLLSYCSIIKNVE